jgi:hypothetical protein
MGSLLITARDRRAVPWIVLSIGLLVTAGGMCGVWVQGLFYQGGFPTAATPGVVRDAFTWPTLFTTLGTMIVSGILLAGPLGPHWSHRRRVGAFLCFSALVLITVSVCGHLAMRRVAAILN